MQIKNLINDPAVLKRIQKDYAVKAAIISGAAQSIKTSSAELDIKSVTELERSEEYVSELDIKKILKEIEETSKELMPKQKVNNTTTNKIVQAVVPEKVVDGVNPGHVLEKRKRDFREKMIADIASIFKTLENRRYPLKLVSIRHKLVSGPPSEISLTLKSRYSVELVDERNRIHKIQFDFPYLTEEGTFVVNGSKKVIINQLVICPIFFLKKYTGMFSSCYSSIIVTKVTTQRQGSYLQAYIGGLKLYLMMLLSYTIGLKNSLKQYGINYTLFKDKKSATLSSNKDRMLELNNGEVVVFHIKNELQENLINSLFLSLKYLPKDALNNLNTLDNKNNWKQAIHKYTENLNSTYLVDQIWNNIVTPLELAVLKSRNEPTELSEIIKYISERVVAGYVTDRNSLYDQRIRTSEILTSLLLKEVSRAYTEYENKRDSGDDTVKFEIKSNRVFSDVITSQSVQNLEYINPIEYLTAMVRVSPIGIGGIKSAEEVPISALDIHNSYFGNIDPLETPDGEAIGVQQHLAMGATFTARTGLFKPRQPDEVKPLEVLSPTTSLIPFVESNEGARVTMAAGQMKQAVPLKEPEIPAVQTGYESLLTTNLGSAFIKKSPVEGKVKSVTENEIEIEDKRTGEIVRISTFPSILRSGQGKHGISIFTPKVKPGDVVKKDQIIAEGSSIREGMITLGVNALAAFMPWKGYNFEDGMVVSESLAKKLTSLHLEEVEKIIEPDDKLIYIADVGTKITEKGQIILTTTKEIRDVESYKHTRADEGKIVDIEVYSNIEEDKIPDLLKPIFERFKSRYIKERGAYPTGSFREKGVKFEGIKVKFFIVQELKLTKGDKLNNRHFNKGVVSIIEKDENMPITPWGDRVEIIYNPLAVLNRMVIGQLCELHTGLISRKLAMLMSEQPRAQFLRILEDVLMILDPSEKKETAKRVIFELKNMPEKEYLETRDQIAKSRFFPLIQPPFKSAKRPDILKALDYLGLKPKYKLKLPEFGNQLTDREVAVGYVYILKLEHLSEKKIHSRGVGQYQKKTLSPTSGKKRGGGQKMGEYELYSLLAWDCPHLVDEFLGPISTDHVTKNQMISEIIRTGKTTWRKPTMNVVKDMMYSLLLGIHVDMGI